MAHKKPKTRDEEKKTWKGRKNDGMGKGLVQREEQVQPERLEEEKNKPLAR